MKIAGKIRIDPTTARVEASLALRNKRPIDAKSSMRPVKRTPTARKPAVFTSEVGRVSKPPSGVKRTTSTALRTRAIARALPLLESFVARTSP